MKRLISLSMLAMLLTSCGGPSEEESNELLDGILETQELTEEEMIDADGYDTPVSEGPSILPPADENEDALTEEE